MRLSAVLPLLVALLASAASAQSPAPAPLVPHTGTSLTYSISFPRGWKVDRGEMNGGRTGNTGESLSATSGSTNVILFTSDLMPVKDPDLPVSWGEQRRIMTAAIIGSDSLMFGMLAGAAEMMGKSFRNVVREMRTLGGQRAGYMSGRDASEGVEIRAEFYVTLKDGVMYILGFVDQASSFAAREPLFARVRDSLVFASAPVSLPEESAPAPSP